MIHLVSVPLYDEYFVCEDCQLDVRVPSGYTEMKSLPGVHAVMEEHEKLGHHCRVYDRFTFWPPQIPKQAAARVIARLTVGETE